MSVTEYSKYWSVHTSPISHLDQNRIDQEQGMIDQAMTFQGSDELLKDDNITNHDTDANMKDISGVSDVTSPVLSKQNSVLKHTLNKMDVDVDRNKENKNKMEEDDAKMLELNEENQFSQTNQGNDDSTLFGEVNRGTQERTRSTQHIKALRIKLPMKISKRSVYEEYSDGRKAPFQLSRDRVRNRKVMLYDQNRWERRKIKEFMDLIRVLGMKKVDSVQDAKFIVLPQSDGKKKGNGSLDRYRKELMVALGRIYSNGCHHVREVYYRDVFYLLPGKPARNGVVFGNERDKLFVLSSVDVDEKYLRSTGLWPLRKRGGSCECRGKKY